MDYETNDIVEPVEIQAPKDGNALTAGDIAGVEIRLDKLDSDIGTLGVDVSAIKAAAIEEQQAETPDYGTQLEHIAAMGAYTNLLLVVVLVFLVLTSGMVFGSSVTRWMKARRD